MYARLPRLREQSTVYFLCLGKQPIDTNMDVSFSFQNVSEMCERDCCFSKRPTYSVRE